MRELCCYLADIANSRFARMPPRREQTLSEPRVLRDRNAERACVLFGGRSARPFALERLGTPLFFFFFFVLLHQQQSFCHTIDSGQISGYPDVGATAGDVTSGSPFARVTGGESEAKPVFCPSLAWLVADGLAVGRHQPTTKRRIRHLGRLRCSATRPVMHSINRALAVLDDEQKHCRQAD